MFDQQTQINNHYQSIQEQTTLLHSIFKTFNINISIEHLSKTQDISILLTIPKIIAAWENEYGFKPTQEDINTLTDLYHFQIEQQNFLTLQ